MTIFELLQNPILPFEIEDEKMRKLFSFFFILLLPFQAKTAAHIPNERLENNWRDYISVYRPNSYSVISPNCIFKNYLGKYSLSDDGFISRRQKGFVCKRKDKTESDYKSVLRHIRNSIAHNTVYMKNIGNRKFILFDDYNPRDVHNARILMSQTDLQNLKKQIMK